MLRAEARKTIKLSIPIILGELAQMSLHLIDTAMVGAIGYKQLAASALVLSVMNIPFVMGIGITIAVSQMVSMAHGRRDAAMVSHYLFNGFVLCLVSAVFIALGLELSKGVLFYLGQDVEVAQMATPFLQLMGWSVIPMILFMALKQFADGLELTKTAMLLSLIALPINVFLNWLLIFGKLGVPRLELIGAGWGTLITRTLIFAVMLYVVLTHKTFRKYVVVGKKQWQIKVSTIKELLHIGIPSSLQISMEAGAFAISGIIVGTISAAALAAHQIALTCASFTFMVSMGLAQGGSIRVSNAFGRKHWHNINLIGRSTLVLSLIYGTLCAIAFVLCRNYLPLLFNNDNQSVAQLAGVLLLYAAIFQISDSTQAIGAGLLRGIKDVKTPTLLIAVAYWVIGIPVGYGFAFYGNMGAAGIWLGFIIGLTLSSLFLCTRFIKQVAKQKDAFLS